MHHARPEAPASGRAPTVPMRLLRTATAVFAAALVLAAPAAAQVAVPDVTGPIPSDAVGSGSHDYPFGSAVDDLAARGYVEEEFFFSGTTVLGGYTSRMLVRRPKDRSKFSGTVIAEWTNVTNLFDVDALWWRSSDHVMREGHAYVTIDVQADGIHAPKEGLKAWGPKRYASLHVPALAQAAATLVANAKDGGMFDIYGQALRAIRSSPKVLGGLEPRSVVGTGTSQSALYLYLYAQVVDQLHKLTNGFLITAASTSTLGVNGYGSVNLPVAGTRVPVMWLDTETDYATTASPDGANYRRWEVAGTTHLDFDAVSVQRLIMQRDLGRDFKPLDDCQHRGLSRIPFKYAQNAALEALGDWIQTGAAPRSQPRFVYDDQGRIARDGHLNALGGVRLPQFAVATSNESRENTGRCKALYGRSVPFGRDTLKLLYPTHDSYVEQVRAASAAAIGAGILTPADAAQTLRDAQAAPVPEPQPSAPARACRSRRVVTFRFPRSVKGRRVTSVRVRVSGRKAVRVRSRSLRVPLVGAPAGIVRVRVTLNLRGGKTKTTVRRFRTCAT